MPTQDRAPTLLKDIATMGPLRKERMFQWNLLKGGAVVTADAANSPINPRQPFKFGPARVTWIGLTELDDIMPFAPRSVV